MALAATVRLGQEAAAKDAEGVGQGRRCTTEPQICGGQFQLALIGIWDMMIWSVLRPRSAKAVLPDERGGTGWAHLLRAKKELRSLLTALSVGIGASWRKRAIAVATHGSSKAGDQSFSPGPRATDGSLPISSSGEDGITILR